MSKKVETIWIFNRLKHGIIVKAHYDERDKLCVKIGPQEGEGWIQGEDGEWIGVEEKEDE